ncbi:B12-binding domain-containing radical SAM protein [Streptomyces sp. NPDC056190]|uniref:B12-binding domain-containing radical SAM protein n=1 Tax=Streptomyces sp. NPDC056190 TaxID=3345741 RepID=UPI0035D91612
MRLTLIQPPNGLKDHFDLAPPLGLLVVASAAEAEGAEVSLVDFNLRGMQDPSLLDGDFYERATAMVCRTTPDVIGLTSMALESHVCLELARRIKSSRPDCTVVLGGPHFTAIATQVLTFYPWVDYVVTGEGERAIRGLLRYIARGGTGKPPENVAARCGEDIHLDRKIKPLESLDEIPAPAYHLVRLEEYFALNPRRLVDYEPGRGCIFRCGFCYSPKHWGQGEQLRAGEEIVADLQRLRQLGADHVFFVQDNFFNFTASSKALCEHIARADLGLTWNCYITLQRLVPEVLDALATAGCREIFVGVDAVTTAAQEDFGKHFYKGWEPLRQRLVQALTRGIVPTCAFMVDLPDCGDHSATDQVLTTALLCRLLGAGIRLNTLTVYNGTATEAAVTTRPEPCSLKPALLLDTPLVIQDNPYAIDQPELFPFHSTYADLRLYAQFVTNMHIAYTVFTGFTRTLVQYVFADGGSLWELLTQIAHRVGDLLALHPAQRRAKEREEFIGLLEDMEVSAATRDAFALDVAELKLGNIGDGPPAHLASGTIGSEKVTIPPFELVELTHAPEDFGVPQAATKQIGNAPRHYMLVRLGGIVRYYTIDESVAAEMHSVISSIHQHQTPRLADDVVAQLVEAGVLTPTG